MLTTLTAYWGLLLFRAIITIVFGCALLLWPDLGLMTVLAGVALVPLALRMRQLAREMGQA